MSVSFAVTRMSIALFAATLCAHDLTPVIDRPRVSAPAPSASPFDPFTLQPEYRHDVVLDTTALSPFRKPEARAAQAASAAAKTAGPNVPAVLAKFHELGLTGVIPSTARHPGLIVLGGNIYHEGEELTIVGSQDNRTAPLLAEHRVVLRSVTAQALGLWVSQGGEHGLAPQNVPIGLLEFRGR